MTVPAQTHVEFERLVEPYRDDLRLHCYRMLGSLQDAEDMLQVTLMRAWQNLNQFEGRAPIRAWLRKIATNACLDTLDKRRRVMPYEARPPASPDAPIEPPQTETLWLEPYPDELLPDHLIGPEARVVEKESISLAFLTALQTLPARQRAVLILSDVLDMPSADVAEALELTLPAVSSALHRARASLAKTYQRAPNAPPDATTQVLLDRYVRAWEQRDVDGLTALLKADAKFSMPPSPSWFLGVEAIRSVMQSVMFPASSRLDWRLRATRANGQPAYIVYQRAPGAEWSFFGVQVIQVVDTPDGARISDVATFLSPELAGPFEGAHGQAQADLSTLK